MKTKIIIFLITSLMLSPAYSSSVKKWSIDKYEEYLKGDLENLTLHEDGKLELGYDLKSISDTSAPYFYTVRQLKDDVYVIGCGHPAAIIEANISSGVTRTLYSDKTNISVRALLPTRDGTLLAGLSPSGEIIEIDKNGDTRLAATIGDSYVWGMVLGTRDEVYIAGGGVNGHLYRLEKNHDLEEVYTFTAKHALTLMKDSRGNIYVGTGEPGTVYLFEKDKNPRVILQADEDEIKDIVSDNYDQIYVVATNALPLFPKNMMMGDNIMEMLQNISGGDDNQESGDKKPVAAPPQITPKQKGSAVYKIFKTGRWQKITNLQDSILLTLLPVDNGNVILGTGDDKARISMLMPDRNKKMIHEFKSKYVMDMVGSADGVIIATGNPGGLYFMPQAHADTGEYVSDVLDAGIEARFAILEKEISGDKKDLIFYTRVGQTEKPDTSWSVWEVSNGEITSPPGRYFQTKVFFNKNKMSSSLDRITVSYRTDNRQPSIKSITVLDKRFDKTIDTASDVAPKNMADMIKQMQGNPPDNKSVSGNNSKPISKPQDNNIEFKWDVTDPDADELVYSLTLKEIEGYNEHFTIEMIKDYHEKSFKWDAAAMPDGDYVVTISASDENGNPPDDFYLVEKTSDRFLIDHAQPEIVLIEDSRKHILGRIEDKLSNIEGISYCINGMHPDGLNPHNGIEIWKPIYSDDGILGDEKLESFSLDLMDLSGGEYLITVMATDSSKNIGYGYRLIKRP